MPGRADLTLKLCVVLQLHRIDLQRIVALLIAADHRVPLETGQLPARAQPEIVACPLQHALLVHHATRQRHTCPNLGDLVLRLHRQMLHDMAVVATVQRCRHQQWRRQQAEQHGDDDALRHRDHCDAGVETATAMRTMVAMIDDGVDASLHR